MDMDSFIILTNSVVVPLIEGKTMGECQRLRRKAKENIVEVMFFGEYVRVTGEKSCKTKVPAKALKDGDALIRWTEQRIDKAWTK